MNKILIVLLLTLTGCSTVVPVAVKFPNVPLTLLEPPKELIPLANNKRKLSDLLENANKNYGTYYEIREKLIVWQEWYVEQKKIYDKLNDK
jgi:hypothetical protein